MKIVGLLGVPILWALSLALRALPRAWALAVGRALGWVWYRVVPIRRRAARAHLQKAGFVEGTEQIVAEMYGQLGMHLVDLICGAPRGSRVRVEGAALLGEVLEAGRGALLLSAHIGPWEALLGVADLWERPIAVVSRHLSTGWADRLWRRWRSPSVRTLEAAGSGRAILRALGRGEAVAMVIDQHDPRPGAVAIPFFGRSAATGLDLARLSALSGAPVVPIFIYREGLGARVVVQPPLAPPARDGLVEATARYSAVVEAAIRVAPAQWLWLHRRWKAAEDEEAAQGS